MSVRLVAVGLALTGLAALGAGLPDPASDRTRTAPVGVGPMSPSAATTVGATLAWRGDRDALGRAAVLATSPRTAPPAGGAGPTASPAPAR
jgi:hypothetical protein